MLQIYHPYGVYSGNSAIFQSVEKNLVYFSDFRGNCSEELRGYLLFLYLFSISLFPN